MSVISEKAGTSVKYTSHSSRATAVHLLDAADYPGRHIMSVTGHKSENSLKTYTGFTSEKTLKKMSHTISENLRDNHDNKVGVTSDIKSASSVEDLDCNDQNLLDFLLLSDSQMEKLAANIQHEVDIPLVENQTDNIVGNVQNPLTENHNLQNRVPINDHDVAERNVSLIGNELQNTVNQPTKTDVY